MNPTWIITPADGLTDEEFTAGVRLAKEQAAAGVRPDVPGFWTTDTDPGRFRDGGALVIESRERDPAEFGRGFLLGAWDERAAREALRPVKDEP